VVSRVLSVALLSPYDDLTGRYTAPPFRTEPALNLSGYVTERALDGLFTVLGEEERKIRSDPAARTTELLQRVFSS
jgi:hypothetical protein